MKNWGIRIEKIWKDKRQSDLRWRDKGRKRHEIRRKVSSTKKIKSWTYDNIC